jgi:hypothetical protein
VNATPNILAAADDFVEIIITVGIFLLAAIVGSIQQAKKKAEEKRAEAERRERARDRQTQPRQGQRTKPPVRQRPPAPPRPPIEALAEQARRVFGVRQAPQAVPQAEQELVLEPAEAKPVRHVRRRAKATRRKPGGLAEAGPAGTEARQPPPAQVGPTREVALDLSRLDAARRAIIYHEVFSGPKALRGEPEPWER